MRAAAGVALMCDSCVSITSIRIGHMIRHEEVLVMPVKVEEHCTVCDERNPTSILVAIPCEIARKQDRCKVNEHLYESMKHLMFSYGPISFQKLVEAITEKVARVDLKTLAGESFLFDMEPGGRA